MRKKNLIILVVILFIILIASFFVFSLYSTFRSRPHNGFPECDAKFLRLYQDSMLKKDFSICDKKEFLKRKLGDLKNQPGCYDVKNEKILSPDNCFTDIASMTQDVSLCEKVAVSWSDDYANNNRFRCFDKITDLKENIDWCDTKMENELNTYRVNYENGTSETKAEEICNKCYCYQYLARKNNDLDLCKKIPEKFSHALNICFTSVALTRNDYNLCLPKNIKPEYENYKCITDIAINKNDVGICKKITDSFFYDECTANFSKANNN